MSNIPGRCPDCQRILFPAKGNVLPPHRVPPIVRNIVNTTEHGSAPLTGADRPWCEGGGKVSRKRDASTLTGEMYRQHLNRQKREHHGSR